MRILKITTFSDIAITQKIIINLKSLYAYMLLRRVVKTKLSFSVEYFFKIIKKSIATNP